MKNMIEIYTSASSATPPPMATSALALQQTFAWLAAEEPLRLAAPFVSEQLAAEIREALAAAERGDTEDLGSFAQYADDEE